jgi:formylglycine-generating enzyme required for sulfatase activity
MAGNVNNWVADRYGSNYYSNSQDFNPTGLESGQNRVVRGSAWNSDEYWLRVAKRNLDSQSSSNNLNGFRCARDATP